MAGEYYHTPESVDEYIRAAEGHSGQMLIDKLKPLLSEGASLLEFGSGPGTDYAILGEHFKVTGSDYSEEFVKRLREKYPEGRFHQLNAADIQIDGPFDAIYSNKVLHHLTDAELAASIQQQHELLSGNGLICHSFWKGEGSEVFKGMFVNYHTKQALEVLLTYKFEVQLMESYAEFEPNDSLFLIAKKR